MTVKTSVSKEYAMRGRDFLHADQLLIMDQQKLMRSGPKS